MFQKRKRFPGQRGLARAVEAPSDNREVTRMVQKLVEFLRRYFVCEHRRRQLQMIVREPITYTRRAQYFCPECNHCWHSGKLPEGI